MVKLLYLRAFLFFNNRYLCKVKFWNFKGINESPKDWYGVNNVVFNRLFLDKTLHAKPLPGNFLKEFHQSLKLLSSLEKKSYSLLGKNNINTIVILRVNYTIY